MAKRRFVRVGDELRPDNVLVRGGELDAVLRRSDAERSHAIYGVYAVSAFALRDASLDELAQRAPLVRFEHLTLLRVDAVRAAGLALVPTGRDPRHFSIEFVALATDIVLLLSCDHRTTINPYHEQNAISEE